MFQILMSYGRRSVSMDVVVGVKVMESCWMFGGCDGLRQLLVLGGGNVIGQWELYDLQRKKKIERDYSN